MKYIKLYEKLENYVELDISKLLIGFIKLLNSENIEFINMLNNKKYCSVNVDKKCSIVKNGLKYLPIFTIFELIINDYLKNNEIKFYDQYNKMQGLIIGKVKEVKFNYLNIPIDEDFEFIVRLNENEGYYVDYTKPIYIKGKPTKIIEYIDIYSDMQNFNL